MATKKKIRTGIHWIALLLAVILSAGACAAPVTNEPQPQQKQSEEMTAAAEPSYFSAAGGSGKVTITCPEVEVTEDSAMAMIVFDSPHYEWVEAEGERYTPENAEEESRKTSVFRIPVRLDEEIEITGLTTAMSQPHEITYRLYISLTQKAPQTEGAGGDAADSEPANGDVADSALTDDALSDSGSADSETTVEAAAGELREPPVIPGFTFVTEKHMDYAEQFSIYRYRVSRSDAAAEKGAAGGKATEETDAADDTADLIVVHGSGSYLLLPEGAEAPGGPAEVTGTPGTSAEGMQAAAGLPEDMTVLRRPVRNLYVAATSSMALFDAAGAIGQVAFTGTQAKGWYIDAPKKALEEGTMVYAGKYSAPDYELLTSSGCGLAVESLMILHAPEVKEKLEELGIPVFIDTSSNEPHPMGRTEWVRLYGILTGHEEEADAFFDAQKAEFARAQQYTDTGKTVAFFSISQNGTVAVRAAKDYIPEMIELAGGRYVPGDLERTSVSNASVRLSMEEFYSLARDADYLVYNATIGSPVRSLSELCAKSALLGDFKAVCEGNVWQVRKDLYQSSDIAARLITDLRRMLTGSDEENMVFLERLEAE